MFFTPFDCFSRKGTLFLLFFTFQNIKKVYPSEENVWFSILLTVFLVRVHFFLFFKFQNMRLSSKTLKFKRPRCLPQQFGVTQGVFLYNMVGLRPFCAGPDHYHYVRFILSRIKQQLYGRNVQILKRGTFIWQFKCTCHTFASVATKTLSAAVCRQAWS